jgi:hypothetical protein
MYQPGDLVRVNNHPDAGNFAGDEVRLDQYLGKDDWFAKDEIGNIGIVHEAFIKEVINEPSRTIRRRRSYMGNTVPCC